MSVDYDVIIIGAGISGLYQLHRLRELGFSVRVFEAGAGLGGTWYWNRYPGARFDSESYSYGYSFSQEILDEWQWSEHFAAQPETLRYLEFVAEKLDLKQSIEFSTRVQGARWLETAQCWQVETSRGKSARARILITAVGPLSAPTQPRFDGHQSFRGIQTHTAEWPREGIPLEGRRVGVIGTGATGVQVIQEVARVAHELTVFQRTPNYCAPLGNRPITAEEQQAIRGSYDEIFDRCRKSYGAFLHDRDPRSVFDVSPEEREAFWEKLYYEPGFGIWLGNFSDVLTDPEANAPLTSFMQRKIAERVHDPEVAAKLTPRDHVFGGRRVPLESGYYEIYNRANVQLVNLLQEPVQRLTQNGLVTIAAEYPLDVLIYATGFDAITGAFDRIDFRGTNGRTLIDKWADGPRTLLGVATSGFPNLFMLVGPHNAATFCNIPRCIEQNVEWVTAFVQHMRQEGITRAEAELEAEDAWTRHVYEVAELTLMSRTDSWFTGVNQNLPGKKRTFYAYAGGAPLYREMCDACAADGYAGFSLTRGPL